MRLVKEKQKKISASQIILLLVMVTSIASIAYFSVKKTFLSPKKEQAAPIYVDFDNQPMIGMLDADTYQVNLRAKPASLVTNVFIEYGPGGLTNSTTPVTPQESEAYTLEINLDNIQANEAYQYRVNWTANGVNKVGTTKSFQAPVSDNSSYKFAVYGDTEPLPSPVCTTARPAPAGFSYIKESWTYRNLDFVISLGDNYDIKDQVEAGCDSTIIDFPAMMTNAGNFRDIYDSAGNSLVGFHTPGEHEFNWDLNDTDRDKNSPEIQLARHTLKNTFINPLNNDPWDSGDPLGGSYESYYAFEWGNALFVSFNTMWQQDLTTERHIISWLNDTLANSNKPWKFVFMHQPVRNARFNTCNDCISDTSGRNELLEVFKNNKVDVVFAGHDHHYHCEMYDHDNPENRDVANPCPGNHFIYDKAQDDNSNLYILSGGAGFKGSNELLQFMEVTVEKDRLEIKCIDPMTSQLCNSEFPAPTGLDDSGSAPYTTLIKSWLISATPSPTQVPITPSVTPTVNITISPTAVASNTPTVVKTSTPTLAKTSTPTVVRTSTPTLAKTNTPAVVRTSTPTLVQTSTPTVVRTSTPTLVRTNTPTAVRTSTPTLAKTSTPTVVRTSTPTLAKTSTPTVVRTSTPTLAKTNTPTVVRTSTPTAVNTITPTPTFADSCVLFDISVPADMEIDINDFMIFGSQYRPFLEQPQASGNFNGDKYVDMTDFILFAHAYQQFNTVGNCD